MAPRIFGFKEQCSCRVMEYQKKLILLSPLSHQGSRHSTDGNETGQPHPTPPQVSVTGKYRGDPSGFCSFVWSNVEGSAWRRAQPGKLPTLRSCPSSLITIWCTGAAARGVKVRHSQSKVHKDQTANFHAPTGKDWKCQLQRGSCRIWMWLETKASRERELNFFSNY